MQPGDERPGNSCLAHKKAMTTILLSGGTGFIGSFLAASLLSQGYRILAMARNDPDGERSKKAVLAALAHDGMVEKVNLEQQFKVLPYDMQALRELHKEDLRTVNQVWHAAAEMSFSAKKLESSFHANVRQTHDLYQLVSDLSRDCYRFNYVSTAYTAGLQSAHIQEILHLQPPLINAYQVTKWSTEMSLANRLHDEGGIPVTLFRPSVVLGHSQTGYYPGHPFGQYMFLFAFHLTAALGGKFLHIDVNGQSGTQIIPIQDLIANASALTAHYVEVERNTNQLDIFHATGKTLLNKTALDMMQEVTKVGYAFGTPRSTLDILADKIYRWVKLIGNEDTRFDDQKLRQVLGVNFTETHISEESLRTLFSWYCQRLSRELEAKIDHVRNDLKRLPLGSKMPKNMSSKLNYSKYMFRLIDRWGNTRTQEKTAKRILKMIV